MTVASRIGIFAVFVLLTSAAQADERLLDGVLHHLRLGPQREWSDFPEQAEGPALEFRFRAEANTGEQTLRLRQQDVKQIWKVLLNSQERGRLLPDENDMVLYLSLPPGALAAGENTLRIEQVGKVPDDIRVGEIALDDRPRDRVLSEATVEIAVTDADHAGRQIPCRITVLDAQGALMSVGAQSGGHLAVRPGVVYTSTGRVAFGLPAGQYTVFASRGFEYRVDSTALSLKNGDKVQKQLAIRREVALKGHVSCDTHVHTLTYSGHGDCTLDERMATLAGEGVELPIATDHNLHVDYQAAAVKHGVRHYFTPVTGNEVTTAIGHFCIFPVAPAAPIPDYKLKDWKDIAESISTKTGAKVVILNHPRDLHSGFRPFGPRMFNAATGEHLDGWVLRANAVELVNSGALQTDVMQTYRDWFALLNRGILLTPVGASDSHDVSRYIVGQGRTYVRAGSDDPGKIDISEAVSSFQAGRVLVSLGLVADIRVNDRFGPGDLVPPSEQVKVEVRVLGPSWVTAEKIELFANGRKVREARIANGKKGGVKWSGEWTLPRFPHDVHLVAVATGPGVRQLFWPIAKPYQPTSPQVNSRVIGSTGAVWIDSDGDGQRTSAHEYARRLVQKHGKNVPELIKALGGYDEAVAVHAASLLHGQGVSVLEPAILVDARKVGAQVESGFQLYFEAWRQCEVARSQRP
jgi:hypothetical protein